MTQDYPHRRGDTFIGVNAFVHVSMQQGTACHPAQQRSFSDLKVGPTVKVWSRSGRTLLSSPGQLEDGTEVVILE